MPNNTADPVVIVNGARTPMGSFQGDLSPATAPELGATSIKAALDRAGVKGEDVEEVIMGCVLPLAVTMSWWLADWKA